MKSFAPKKNPLAAYGLAILLLLITSGAARAQGQEPQPTQQEQSVQSQEGKPGNNLMQRLNLTPEQRAQLREIRMQNEPETRELSRRVRLARRALDEAIYADAANESLIEQRAHALSDAQAALVRLRAATELKVRRVLTPEQLQSFRDLRIQAQRQQMLQRRLRRGAQQQPSADSNPADATTPPDATRDLRPSNTPRMRPRNRLGRP
ncbi:MAG: periplasmic protein CpxP/Spy [Acidobacteriota bacterium]|jgi:Spy/CpxP family protein refolding chaperone|nr:periplasmic protein CpxP/Spy [Acidobacteriota bacterium]